MAAQLEPRLRAVARDQLHTTRSLSRDVGELLGLPGVLGRERQKLERCRDQLNSIGDVLSWTPEESEPEAIDAWHWAVRETIAPYMHQLEGKK